jgi:glycosyltransferase involved in cell wall biosynthesis
MIQPVVTTVIPTYRRPELLDRAIRSVLAQDYKAIRIRVYDNASGDETEQVVAQFSALDPRVEYHCHATNIGAVANINFGVRAVDTAFFSLLSDDDFLLPHFYSKAMNALIAVDEAKFFTATTIIYDSMQRIAHYKPTSWKPRYYNGATENAIHVINDHIPMTGVVFRSSIRTTSNFLNAFASDYEYMMEAAARHSFIVSDHAAAVFTVHSEGFSSRRNYHGRSHANANPWSIEFDKWLPHLLLSILSRGLSLPVSDPSQTIHLLKAWLRVTRRTLVSECLVRAAPQGAWAELHSYVEMLDVIGVSAWVRAVLGLLEFLGRHKMGWLITEPVAVMRAIQRWRKRIRSKSSFESVTQYAESLTSTHCSELILSDCDLTRI